MPTTPSLDTIGLEAGTDKASSHHDYLTFYEIFFAPLRNDNISILEIGVLGGASLRTWEAYFPHAQIFGVDINPTARLFEHGRIKIVLADQSNIQELVSLAIKHGPFDIIIEDGSHMWEHQITSLRTLFPFLNNNGLYIVEDLQTNYGTMQESYRGVATSTCVDYLKQWVDLRVADDQWPLEKVEDPFLRTYGRAIDFISFYKRACLIKKRFQPVDRYTDPGAPLAPVPSPRKAGAPAILAHMSELGDMLGITGFVNPTPAYPIQGILIVGEAPLLEYRVRSLEGQWSAWVSQNQFAGTKGMSRPITGFTIRLSPQFKKLHRLTAFGRFIGGHTSIVEAGEGEDCVHDATSILCGIQIILD